MSYQDRLDPGAPWRYECLNCGSVVVRFFRGKQAVRNYPKKVSQTVSKHRYAHVNCRHCGANNTHVRDRKERREVKAELVFRGDYPD